MAMVQPWREITPENRKVIFCMSSFVGTHTIMSHPNIREWLIGKLTLANFVGVYSLISAATLLPALHTYVIRTKNTGPMIPLIEQNQDLCFKIGVLFKLLAIQFIPLFQTGTQPAEVGLTSTAKQERSSQPVRGVMKITRHPLFWMFNFFGLGLILTNGTYSDLYFNAFLLSEGVFGALHQDYRHRQSEKLDAKFFENTTWYPNVFNIRSALQDISWDRLFAEVAITTFGILYFTGKLQFSNFKQKN
ncbi:hypothetical protein RFI_16238 [Reticulomyxa filosa]|uniref:NnrU domain-containing protein n=1 Tax=Reticulomyxa filosa TaxID=46433 RepID=X6N6P3_RETFI|nr:hypothetical protein RFI_16238 [Reticulomyxa filosa]|eukprot:ETO20967.1 hypothetical protein RFI_16238 [Reticulomyxa filosa]